MDSWIIGVLSAIGGLVAGCIAAIIRLRKNSLDIRKGVAEIRQNERKETVVEFQFVIDGLKDQIKGLVSQNNLQEAKIVQLQAEHLQCIKDNASTLGELRLLKFRMEQFQTMATTASISLCCNITADLNGTILEVEGSVKEMLNWTSEDLVGRNVDVIIPRDIQARHHKGLEITRLSGMVRPPDIAIQSFARTKLGDKIPVIVSLNGWEREAGKRLITAQIIHRKVFSVSFDPSNADLKEPIMNESTLAMIQKLPPLTEIAKTPSNLEQNPKSDFFKGSEENLPEEPI